MILPPRLSEGAHVALVAPAGPVTEARITTALRRCADLGLHAVVGEHARGSFGGYLAGTDEDRLRDLQRAFTNPEVDAVWALRGGYGTMRLLPQLDLSGVVDSPRAFIGFSDNTAVHLALHARGVVSFHGPHAGGGATEIADRCFHRVLWNAEPAGVLEQPAGSPTATLMDGVAEGPLLGGNLSLLAAMCGTRAPLTARGAILFVEEVGEPLYRIDRMWTQLLLCGSLDGVAGLAFGQFSDCGEGGDVVELLQRLAQPLGVPTVAGFPIGHQDENWTLPIGVRARLDGTAGTLELLEPAVS